MKVMVTGASGSIGSELARILAQEHDVVLLDQDESGLFDLQHSLPGQTETCLCNIRDRERLHEAVNRHRPDIIYHAAAYKHVPMLEDEPMEAVYTNIIGTENVVSSGVPVLLISTDKAAAPNCVMGMTKAIAERIVLRAGGTVVRLGNVTGSRGSFLPLFERQAKAGGPITVTHKDATRYLMTIPQAASLIVRASTLASGIYVLDMGEPVRIDDIAQQMSSEYGVEVVYIGLRPGEKLHETIVSDSERLVFECEGIYRVRGQHE